MGGGSSSDQKTNEINKQVFNKLQQQQKEQNKNLKGSKANSKLNSANNSPKNSPRGRNNQDYDSPIKDNQYNGTQSPQQMYNSSGLRKSTYKNKKDSLFQSNLMSADGRQSLGNVFMQKKGSLKLSITLFHLNPIQFKYLNKKQESYQSNLKWNFEQKSGNWNFILQQPQTNGLKFILNSQGQLIQGDSQKWAWLNPSFQEQNLTQLQDYLEQIQLIEMNDPQKDPHFYPSFQELKQNKKNLNKLWMQEQTDKFAQFQNKKRKKENKTNQPKFNSYKQLKKYFNKNSVQWNLSVFVQEKNYEFFSCMINKINPQTNNNLLQNFIQKEIRILNLKKQIYIQKIKLLKQSNFH